MFPQTLLVNPILNPEESQLETKKIIQLYLYASTFYLFYAFTQQYHYMCTAAKL